MRINHNIAALNTYRQLNAANNAQQKSMEKLSSGLRINSAADDAAGLAISEKMRGQIRGLDQAQSNAQDGISLIQTAEGALNETQNILQRMRELAVQASNDTNTADDRAEIQKEIDQLTLEIDRIGESTEFNTKKLLNGQAGITSSAQTATVEDVTDITIKGTNPATTTLTAEELNAAISKVDAGTKTEAGVYEVVVTANATAATLDDGGLSGADASVSSDTTITINGVNISLKANDTEQDIIDKINNASEKTGVIAIDQGSGAGLKLTQKEVGSSKSISVTGANADLQSLGLTDSTTATALSSNGTDATGTINGSAATGIGNTLTLNKSGDAADGISVKISDDLVVAAGKSLTFNAVIDNTNVVDLQIGANNSAEQSLSIDIRDMRAKALGVDSINVTSATTAKNAIDTIDEAIKAVSSERSKLGAYQNRLEHTINNLGTSSENLTAAESRIRDVDMAKEMMEQTKNSILAQAAQAMLAQANQQPQGVLQLLR
ncbi:flagellin [Garciella nitratireducens]|uniref:flagellin N-terminal helical domain-containing protein n=1 Tax=Garciella nitratireducens TaxID=218205 RepID=UPI001BD52FC4|nr:flagellin [Garciella nitratireducens]